MNHPHSKLRGITENKKIMKNFAEMFVEEFEAKVLDSWKECAINNAKGV